MTAMPFRVNSNLAIPTLSLVSNRVEIFRLIITVYLTVLPSTLVLISSVLI